MKLVDGGFVINGATPSSFLNTSLVGSFQSKNCNCVFKIFRGLGGVGLTRGLILKNEPGKVYFQQNYPIKCQDLLIPLFTS